MSASLSLFLNALTCFGQEIEDEMVCFIYTLIFPHTHPFQRLEVRRPPAVSRILSSFQTARSPKE